MALTQGLTQREARLRASRRTRPRDVHPIRWWMRRKLWLIPSVAAVVGTLLSLSMVHPSPAVLRLVAGLAWRATPTEARTALTTVMGIAISSLSIVLSLSMLVVQNAAGQYSPRLLRLYVHSAGIRVVIPVFVATGVFCLVGIREFGLMSGDEALPRPALSMALLLISLCGAALVFQVLHTLQLMRVENLVRQVRQDTVRVARALDARIGHDTPRAAPAPPSPSAWPLRTRTHGFVVDIDAHALLELAESRALVIHVDALIGEPVLPGALVGHAQPDAREARESPELAEALAQTLLLGRWRVLDADVALGVRQLVDMAIKALSPGINDPYTAVEALDQLTILLCDIAPLRLGPRVLADSTGRPRVHLRGLTLGDYLELASDQISRYGAAEPAITVRLVRLAGEVGRHARAEADRRAAHEALQRVMSVAERVQATSPQLGPLRHYAHAVERAMEGGPMPPLPAIGF
ncbi:DUF2254 domain-containing protein [Myxococcaceae bacterium GXIMD 01537]